MDCHRYAGLIAERARGVTAMRARSPLSPKTPPWKAQVRLCKRSRPLSARGKTANPVVVAIARKLRAVLWAIAQEVRLPAELGQRARSPMDPATRFRTAVGRGAAPGWGHHRRREAAARNQRASREAGTRRRPVRWSPTPGDPQAQPSSVTGSGSADDQRSSEKDDDVKTFRCGLDIGSQINAPRSAAEAVPPPTYGLGHWGTNHCCLPVRCNVWLAGQLRFVT
jgi:hypothetical protein